MHRITGGMQQIHLKKGDIIVNHKQMEELEKGEAKSGGGRGRLIGSFANGTVDGMHAFSGTGGSGPSLTSKSSKSSSSSKKNTKATNDNTKATKSNTDAKEDEKSAAEKLKEEFDKLYDWIEIFIDRTENTMNNWQTRAEHTIESWQKRNSYLKNEMDVAQSFYKDLSASYSKYIAQANASGLESKYKSKVQQGRKNEIENIDTDSELRARVDEFSKWYEKALDVESKRLELQNKLIDLQNERLQNIQDYYDAAVSYHSSTQDWYAAQQGTHEARGDSLSSSNALITKQLEQQQKQSAMLRIETYKYYNEMENARKIFGASSQEYYKAYSNYMQIQSAYQESAAAAYELRDALLENARTIKEQVVDKWNRVLDRIDAARNYYSARPDSIRNQDAKLVETYIYENSRTQSKISALNSSIDTYRNQMQLYDPTSKKYQELADKVNSAEVEIMNLGADVYKNLDEIFNLYTKRFDDSVEKLSTAIDEASGLIDLMGTESFVDKSGNITDNGQAGIMLYATIINKNTDAMEDWRSAIDEVNESYKAGEISEERRNELVSEYTKNIQDATAKNKEYANSLIDIYKKQLENENALLNKNIEKRKEALQAKEDYYNYDRTIRDQNKDIQSLEAQIAALSNSSDARSEARRLQLEEQLRQAREQQDDTLRQHRNDLISQGYDSLSENIQTAYDDTINALETNSTFQQEIVSNMLDNIVANYASAYGTIVDIISGTGDVISYTLSSALETTARDDANAQRVTNRAKQTINTSDGLGTGGYNNNHINTSTGNKTLDTAQYNARVWDSTKETANKYTSDYYSYENQGIGGNTINRTYASASASNVSMKVGESKSVTVKNGKILGVYDKDLVSSKVSGQTITFTGKKVGSEGVVVATDNGDVHISVKVTAATTTTKSTTKTTTTTKTSTPAVSYYPATSAIHGSISETLMKAGGYSWEQVKNYSGIRSKIAKANGISNYKGTAAQNIQMLELLKQGKLIKPKKKGGIIDQIIPLSRLKGGDDGLITAQLGEAVLPKAFMNDVVPEFMNTVKQTTKLLQPIGGNGGEVNVHYDSLLTVNGNVDKEALPGLRDLLQQSYEYTSQKMYKDLRKIGYK